MGLASVKRREERKEVSLGRGSSHSAAPLEPQPHGWGAQIKTALGENPASERHGWAGIPNHTQALSGTGPEGLWLIALTSGPWRLPPTYVLLDRFYFEGQSQPYSPTVATTWNSHFWNIMDYLYRINEERNHMCDILQVWFQHIDKRKLFETNS